MAALKLRSVRRLPRLELPGLITGAIDDGLDHSAPIILSPLAYEVANNTPLQITLLANEVVTYTDIGGANAASFSLSGNIVTFQPSPAGIYTASFLATDVAGNSTPFNLTVTVRTGGTPVPGNQQPRYFAFGLISGGLKKT